MAASVGSERMQRLRTRVRYCMVGSTALLLAWIAAWIFAGGVSVTRVLVAAIVTVPLWLSLPRLNRGERRTYSWMTLAVVPYLVVAITEIAANPNARGWATGTLLLGFVVFIAAVAYLRLTSAGRSNGPRE